MNKGEETRSMIIEKAADLFNRYGYDGCSLSDIMTATSLQKGGIYNHFSNKDEIALAAFDYTYNQMIERFRSKLNMSDTPSIKLKKMFDMFRNYFDHPDLRGGCPIANTAVYSADTHDLLRKRVISAIDQMEDYIMIKLNEGKRTGEFQSDFDSKELARMILATLEGAIILSRARNDKSHLKSVVDQLEQFVFEKSTE